MSWSEQMIASGEAATASVWNIKKHARNQGQSQNANQVIVITWVVRLYVEIIHEL